MPRGDEPAADTRVDVRRRQVVRAARTAEHDVADVLHDLHEGVEEGDLLRPVGQDADRVEDRAGEEEELRGELPDLFDVAEPDVERAEQQAEADGEQVELREQWERPGPTRPAARAAG